MVDGPGGHVRHLLVGLQQPPGRVRAAARARCHRAHLRVGRPLHGRRALHGRGAEGRRPRRLGALHGRLQRPSPRAGRVRRRLARGVGAPCRRHGAVAPALAGGAGRRALLAARLGAPRLRAHRLPDHARGGLGGRIHEHRLPRLRGARLPEAPAARAVEPLVHGHVAAGTAHRPRAGADPLVPALARRRAERDRRGAADRGVRPSLDPPGTRPRGGARRVAQRGGLAAGAAHLAHALAGGGGRRRDPRARRRRPCGVDLVCRAPAVGPARRPARRRCVLAHLRLGAARAAARRDGPPAPEAHRHLTRARRLPVRAGLRRVPGRHLGAGGARRAQPHPPLRSRRPSAARAGCPDGDRARAGGDLVGVRDRPPRSPGPLRRGLAEHLAATGSGNARRRTAKRRARAARAGGAFRAAGARAAAHDGRGRARSRHRMGVSSRPSCGASKTTSSAARPAR